MALGLGRGKERREGRGWSAELRRNNRPKGEFFLFPPPSPFVRLSRQKYAKPCAPTVEKLGRLIGQSPPNLTWTTRVPSLGCNMPKKKKGKKEKGRRRRGGVGGKKNMNHFSQELGVGCASG